LIRIPLPAPWLRGIDRPAFTCAVTLVAYGIFVAARLANLESDPSAFVVAGDRVSNPAEVPAALTVLPDSMGYDGQAFYRLALDPFTTVDEDYGITLGDPAWRQQRILYPLLVWCIAQGDPAQTAIWLIGVSLAALGAVGWLAGDLARLLGRHAATGLPVAFYPGFLYSLSRDLAEPLTAALVLLGIAFFLRGRHARAALATSLAVLARETSLLVPAGMGIVLLWRSMRGRGEERWPTALLYLAPLLVYLGAQLLLARVWGSLPVLHGAQDFQLPFSGIWEFLSVSVPPQDRHQRLMLVNFVFMVCFSCAVVRASVIVKGLEALKISWLLYAVLAMSFTTIIWATEIEFLRALNEYWLLGAVLVVAVGGSQPRFWWSCCLATATIWLMVYGTRTHWI
jgi:hypothetical protein